MHFGRDVLAAPDVDLEDLLSALAPSEVQQLVDEMAADPDDKHLPVRKKYRHENDREGCLPPRFRQFVASLVCVRRQSLDSLERSN